MKKRHTTTHHTRHDAKRDAHARRPQLIVYVGHFSTSKLTNRVFHFIEKISKCFHCVLNLCYMNGTCDSIRQRLIEAGKNPGCLPQWTTVDEWQWTNKSFFNWQNVTSKWQGSCRLCGNQSTNYNSLPAVCMFFAQVLASSRFFRGEQFSRINRWLRRFQMLVTMSSYLLYNVF